MNAALGELRENLIQFLVADQGLAPDDRDMKRAVLVDHRHEVVNQLLSLEVADGAQGQLDAAEVVVAVGVAAGTVKRALPRNLDREGRRVAGEDSTPGCKNAFHRPTIS